jgi:predicted O-methyltransferase YrrM
MVAYDLAHLTQTPDQRVLGPIQDDEALLFYALCRVMLIRRVLEIGGMAGYSATNFCHAVGPQGIVYSVDVNLMPHVADNHRPIIKNAHDLTAEDVDNQLIDLLFFDAHDYDAQISVLEKLTAAGIVTDRTVLALHDTNLHPGKTEPTTYQIDEGWVNHPVERRMVNTLHDCGYDAICLHTDVSRHGPQLPFRHGLTIMRRFAPLTV